MQQGERLAHAVCFRASYHLKPVVKVKADRLRVLLVHIEPASAEVFHRVIQKRGADPSPRPA